MQHVPGLVLIKNFIIEETEVYINEYMIHVFL